MAEHIPLTGAFEAAGGILLPDELGETLALGLLRETGALRLAGDADTTKARKTEFPIWLGKPTAEMVGEGERKPVTGAEFGSTEMNVKKIASIVLFTDEQREDVADGELDSLVDTGVQEAIGESIDRHATGKDAGANWITGFDSSLRQSTAAPVPIDLDTPDGLQTAMSAAMGALERNGYGDKSKMGLLTGFGFDQFLRDARETTGAKRLYGLGGPTYGVPTELSTNLGDPEHPSDADGNANELAFLVYRPNLHVRIRHDVRVKIGTEASIELPNGETVNLYQDNLTAVRYEVRLAWMVHDLHRAVVPLVPKPA